MTWLARSALGFLLVKLLNLLINLVRFPVLAARPPAEPTAAEGPECLTVSVLVPMRDEARTLPGTLPGILRQRGAIEILVLDDGSNDDSPIIARALAGTTPHVRILRGTPPPAGWVGKNWACQQLADAARGNVLAFCDADVFLADGALPAALAEMSAQRADVFSVFPRQLTGSLGEALLLPFIDDFLLCFLPFPLLSLDVPAAATANGSLLLLTRGAYDTLGGHTAVRSEIVEDVVLARRARQAGLKLGLALGGNAVATRMYRGYPEAVRGLGRGLLPVSGGSRAALVLAAAWHLLVYTLPVALALRSRLWRTVLALGIAERGLVAAKTAPRTGWQAPLITAFPVAFVPVIVQALRREQQWKGRSCS